ncbi:kinase-like domain-containing protein [Desarmillaria tabescens]|uniref:Kinase-like domain-containing protein n=1 Tax=Armillaria tabescens TaxID=1929756 RepID=A0AA39NDN1_ARMTA|nr:kinase-like domain-containing protein [Desarmillaria tabescens]KAK0463553.1 kinase-like domain-containing protein [Desarmillaria tabescens]
MKCLRALSKARSIVPSSFSSRDVTREGPYPISGGGFADIYKGRLDDTQVCLKVLRIFIPEKARAKLLRDFCREALVWRQFRHPNILPFLGVSEDLFAPSYCLISPWMDNGNIMSYLEAHPDHDRLTSLIQVAEGMKYLHNLDPPVVHSDIRGANILVMDDLRCCLADFGLSLFAESQALDSTSRMSKGSIRWLAPEYMDSTLFDRSYLTARDIYAYGCTIIEIFTGESPFSGIKNDAGVMCEVVTKRSRPPRPPLHVFPNDSLWFLVELCLINASRWRPDAK